MLSLTFWDVQHGSAVYIKTPNETQIAVDLGIGSFKGGGSFSPLLYMRDKLGVKRLDEVIITHPHADHLDDIGNFNLLSPRVIRRPNHLNRDEVLSGNTADNRDVVEQYLVIDRRYDMPVSENDNPELPQNNDGVLFQCFTPNSTSHSNLNNHSIVTIISYQGCKVLIPGDNESASWSELLSNSDFIRAIQGADIMLASHHGREAGFHADLFKHFRPRLTIISDGSFSDTSATNRYSQVSQGWTVHRRNGGDVTRNCVTTRNDGVVQVNIGRDAEQAFIAVYID